MVLTQQTKTCSAVQRDNSQWVTTYIPLKLHTVMLYTHYIFIEKEWEGGGERAIVLGDDEINSIMLFNVNQKNHQHNLISITI